MQSVSPKVARSTTWIAAAVAVTVAVILPLGYFLIGYQHQLGELGAQAEINAQIASDVIKANPELWRFQHLKLVEFLSRRPRQGHAEIRRIFDNENKLIAESADPLKPPVIALFGHLLDSGLVVGRIEISRSLRPLLLETGVAALFGLLLALAVFVTMRTLPLRALKRALEDNTHLLKEVQHSLERIQALREIDLAITSTLDLRSVLDLLLEKIEPILPYSVSTVRLLNKETGKLEPVACRNINEEEWRTAINGADKTLTRALPDIKAPLMIRNVQTDPRSVAPDILRKHGLVSALRVPLIAKGEVLGVLTFFTKEEHEFSDDEVEFLVTLGGQAAIAIHNAQLYEEMTRANKTKDEFLSVMSHELRTPLNVVMGYTGMIKDGMLGEINQEQMKALEKVINRSGDLLRMINEILVAASLEAGTVKVEIHEVNLVDFFDDLRSQYEVPLDKELTLNWDYPPQLPMISIDSGKLKHILQNLINNAVKFTNGGHITISARYIPDAQAMNVKVADTGIGIPEEMLSSIFEMFRQVDSSETRSFGGVGVGLYIVKKYTDMLGGKIEVESEPDRGSTFTVTIPC